MARLGIGAAIRIRDDVVREIADGVERALHVELGGGLMWIQFCAQVNDDVLALLERIEV